MLESNNRPFNGTNLVDDLAKEFKKSTTVKALAALSEEKAIQVKLFGKVKIYLADQSKFQVPDEAELAALEAECQTLASDLQGVLAEKAAASQRRAQLEAAPTNTALFSSVKELTERTSAQQTQLKECVKANANAQKSGSDRALVADKKTLDKALEVVSKAGNKRKAVCKAAVSDLACNTGISRHDLLDRIGIDEDGYLDPLFSN